MGIFRLGVLGGTFNPVHFGHLQIARSIRKLFSLSEVLFVVSATPPHKSPRNLIALNHRYAMVSLATAEEPAFVPSLVELEPDASPYSLDTMRKITRNIGRDRGEIYFIAGGDSLCEIKTWRKSEKLLTSYNFIFVHRPGADAGDLENYLPRKARGRVCDCTGFGPVRIRREINADRAGEKRVFIVDVDAPDISSTRIRKLAASGKSIRRLVPGPVCSYIKKLQLYGEK